MICNRIRDQKKDDKMDRLELAKKHSFAIMAYKDAPYLPETVQSILAQNSLSQVYISTSTPYERILSISNKYKIPLYINDGITGIVGDWVYALSKSKTPFVTLVDQDDLYSPQYAITMIKYLDKYRDSLIAFTNYREIDSIDLIRKMNTTMRIKNILLWPFIFKNYIRSDRFKKLLISFGNPICSPSVTYNLNNLDVNTIFSGKCTIALNWDAWLRMCYNKGVFIDTNKKLLNNRIHTKMQSTSGISEGMRYQEDYNMFRRIWPASIAKLLTHLYSKSYRINI